jgi:hypothetical protein
MNHLTRSVSRVLNCALRDKMRRRIVSHRSWFYARTAVAGTIVGYYVIEGSSPWVIALQLIAVVGDWTMRWLTAEKRA